MKDPLDRLTLDSARVYLGIDNRQPNLLRVVGLSLDDLFHLDIGAVWSKRFRSLEALQSSLKLDRTTIVATTEFKQDPFGALSWLKDQGLQVSRFGPYDTPHFGPEWGKCVTRPFRLAFELAHYCAYQHGAPKLLWELFRDARHIELELDNLGARVEALEEWSSDPHLFDEVPF